MKRFGAKQSWGLVRVAGRDRLVCASRGKHGIVVAPAKEVIGESTLGAVASDSPGVVIPMADLSVRHEHMRMPPIRGRGLNGALARDRRKRLTRDEGVSVSYAQYRNRKENAYLVVTVSRELPETTLRWARDAGYRVGRLVTPGASIAGLITTVLGPNGTDKATIAVHLGEEIGSVAYILDGVLQQAREFRMPVEAPPADGEGAASTPTLDPSVHELIIGEIGRSVLFFNHQFQGKPLERVLISSDLDGIEELVPACVERFRVPVSLTADVIGLAEWGFGDGNDEVEKPGLWLSAIAAAVIGLTNDPDVNLLPPEKLDETSRRRAVLFATVATLLLAGGMLISHISHQAAINAARSEIDHQRLLYDASDDFLTDMAEVRVARIETLERAEFLESARRPLAMYGETLRLLSLVQTDSLRVESIWLAPDEAIGGVNADQAPLSLRVKGQVTDVNGKNAHEQFNRFVERLRQAELFSNATIEPLTVDHIDELGQSMLRFEVVLLVER